VSSDQDQTLEERGASSDGLKPPSGGVNTSAWSDWEEAAADLTPQLRSHPATAQLPGAVTAADPVGVPPAPSVAAVAGRKWVGRGWRIATIALLVALLGSTGGLGYLSIHNGQVAEGWKSLDVAQVASTHRVTAQLATANHNITTLNGHVQSLNGTISSLQAQLSSVADQKEKALDQATVLQRLLGAAGVVANDLQQCVTSTQQFESALNNAAASGDLYTLGSLEPVAVEVDQTCGRAEQANQELQTAIQTAA
jgi:hypothetical protein